MNAARTAVVSLTMQVHIKAANVWRDQPRETMPVAEMRESSLRPLGCISLFGGVWSLDFAPAEDLQKIN